KIRRAARAEAERLIAEAHAEVAAREGLIEREAPAREAPEKAKAPEAAKAPAPREPLASSAERLTGAILAQAREEAEKIRQAANAEAERLVGEARSEAAAHAELTEEKAKARALQEKAKGLAAAKLQARQFFLQGREELLDDLFDRASDALAGLRKKPEYPALLLQLAEQAIAALAGDEFVVEVPPDDVALAEQSLSAIQKKIEMRANPEVGGGCIVWQKDRRAFYDNTLGSIFAGQKPQLRFLVAQWLWGDEARWSET
ncbi:MAG TPA: V-type ATP synthase subunit E, partial [Candidatus Binataceae bacterium]|nr:V-type ATP synthase subunit E [Candidatus Binataceae bacterium]